MIRKIGFYFITDSRLSKNGIIDDTEKAIAGGSRIIQYRDKGKNYEEALLLARSLRKITAKHGALLIINDSVSLCLDSAADGVHLGQDDTKLHDARKLLSGRIIGVTAHNLKEALAAEADGADYLGVSPIFPTFTKPDAGIAAGTALIRKIRLKVGIPIVAIGGINLKNAKDVIDSGADGICAISAASGENVEHKVKAFTSLFAKNQMRFRPSMEIGRKFFLKKKKDW